jgi:hypothetical protein
LFFSELLITIEKEENESAHLLFVNLETGDVAKR